MQVRRARISRSENYVIPLFTSRSEHKYSESLASSGVFDKIFKASEFQRIGAADFLMLPYPSNTSFATTSERFKPQLLSHER